MIPSRQWLVVTLGLFVLVTQAWAAPQAVDVPPPKEPVLPRAPSVAQWTIHIRVDRDQARRETLEPDAETGGDPGEGTGKKQRRIPVLTPVQIQVNKDGNVYREIITWSDGKKTEKWIVEDMQLREVPRTGDIMRVDGTSFSDDVSDYRTSDFEPLQWIDKENYKGVKLVRNQPLYEFVADGSKRRLTAREIARGQSMDKEGGGATPAGANRNQQVAYIDARTQMPVYIDDGYAVRVYKFSPTAERLVIPEKFAEKFREWKDLINRRTRPATPP